MYEVCSYFVNFLLNIWYNSIFLIYYCPVLQTPMLLYRGPCYPMYLQMLLPRLGLASTLLLLISSLGVFAFPLLVVLHVLVLARRFVASLVDSGAVPTVGAVPLARSVAPLALVILIRSMCLQQVSSASSPRSAYVWASAAVIGLSWVPEPSAASTRFHLSTCSLPTCDSAA